MELGSLYELRHQSNKDLLPYVGKTIDYDDRKRNHKSKCNNPKAREYNLDVYKYIRANGGWDAWYMIEIYYGPDFEQKEKDLLKANFDGYINSVLTGRTHAEHYQDNKEKKIQYQAKYREANRDEINKKKAEKISCPNCGEMSTRNHLARHMRTQKCMNYSSAPSSELSSASEVG